MRNECEVRDSETRISINVVLGSYILNLTDDTMNFYYALDNGGSSKVGTFTIKSISDDCSDHKKRFRIFDDKEREVGYIMFNQYPGISWVKVD